MRAQLAVLASLASAAAAAGLARLLVPPTPRLAPRLRPYTIGARTALGRAPGRARSPGAGGSPVDVVARLFRPILLAAADRLGRLIDRSSDEGLAGRIRRAGLFPDLPDLERVAYFRLLQLRTLVAWGVGGAAAAAALRLPTRSALAVAVLSLVTGATRQRGRLERAIEDRRSRMRVEIYTVNQLLAIRARAGGGAVHSVQSVVARGRGEVVGELGEALRLHRAGLRATEAFARIAELTPEPYCARTYRVLAVAEERGVDLAAALLALSEDVREARREGIRRAATRRRAAMLVPTIAILAPVMLLFVGAPLPQLVLGFR